MTDQAPNVTSGVDVEKRVYNMLNAKQDVQKQFLKMFADSNEVW